MHSRDQLDEITRRTLGHYTDNAEGFAAGTWDHDVSQNIHALLSAITEPAPLRILDLGCGPGRDLVALSALGHAPTGLDGSAKFCAMARAASGCPVRISAIDCQYCPAGCRSPHRSPALHR